MPRNDDGGDVEEVEGTLSIIKHLDRPFGRLKKGGYLILSMRLHKLIVY